MINLEEAVLPQDFVQARTYLDGYKFYKNRTNQDLKLAYEYLDRFNELVARKKEHDFVESLKEYAAKKGVTHVEFEGVRIHINVIKL